MFYHRIQADYVDTMLGNGSPFITSLREGSDKSLHFQPSSTGTSQSSLSSFSSVHSHSSQRPRLSRARSSRASSASSASAQPQRRRKRRSEKRNVRSSLATPLNRYQCTFCTETFRTKHDWQRHEKSLHLPLERWACSPNGPRIDRKSVV